MIPFTRSDAYNHGANMEYFDFDGNLHSIIGDLKFSITPRPKQNQLNDPFSLGPRDVLTANEKFNPKTGEEFFIAAKRIVASYPPFLQAKDCSWIISYIDKIRTLLSIDYLGYTSNGLNFRSCLSEADIYSFIDAPDPISITRLLYTYEFLCGLSHGFIHTGDYFGINNGSSRPYTEYEIFETDEESIIKKHYRVSSAFRDSKSFKTDMTRFFYKGTNAIITIPNDEKLVCEVMDDKIMTIESGEKFVGTMIRFYKSEPFWTNCARFEFYPTIKGEIKLRLEEIPMFAMTLEMARGVESMVIKNRYGGEGYSCGFSFNAFIPLHWVSHVRMKSGGYSEVNNHPTPQPCSYDPMVGAMPMNEFTKRFEG